ncbi:MAG TPA: permease-like cell division protein FtsX [bacterium]|nr:permease-like cell division protein FtsX [bacterium]
MMNALARFFYVLGEGLRQMLRSKGLSAAVIVTVAAALFQLSIFLGLDRVLDRALSSAQENFQLVVFLSSSAKGADRDRVQSLLGADARVASVKVVTRDEALAEFRQDPEIDQMIQALGENPLPDSFDVTVKKEAVGHVEDLVALLKKDPQVDEVSYGKGQFEALSRMLALVRWVGAGLGGLIFLAALFIISNTLTLSLWARREDLALMNRLGAPSWMRWGPYLWEGFLQGFLGALLVCAFLALFHLSAGWLLRVFGGFTELMDLPLSDWVGLDLTLCALGAALGALGASLALRKKWVWEVQ